MQLASRMNQLAPEGAFAVLAKAQEQERQGKSIIHLEIGQPDFETPSYIAKAGIKAIREGKTKYTPSLGIMPLRKSLAEYITKTRKVSVNHNNIAVTPSCKTGLFCALASIVDSGDEVLYPDPGFPAYKILIEFFGGKPVPIPLVEERQFSFDMKVFKKKFSSRTKAVILNFPSNPTGTTIPAQDLAEIASLVNNSDSWIISDEIYSRILYTHESFISIYSLPKMQKRTIIVDGFSKTYSMTGWRLGYMVIPQNMIERIDNLLTHSVACTASFTQEAGLAALVKSQESVNNMVKEFKKRRDFVVETLNSIKGVFTLTPQGAFYVFPNIKSFRKSSKEIASYLLHEAGVALLDGTAFGKYGEGYLRISYATDIKNLQEGLRRIKSALARIT